MYARNITTTAREWCGRPLGPRSRGELRLQESVTIIVVSKE
jgi:hypothetical protein